MFDPRIDRDRSEILKRVGSTYQIAGTRHYRLSNGYSHDTKAIDVKTGSGLEYTIVEDRGLDLSLVSYKGINLTYFS